MTFEELEELCVLMREQFGGKEPRQFQMDLVQAQEERRDALCQAATGQGKTAVAAGPYVLKRNEGMVTLMVSPLIGLQEEMVSLLAYHAFAAPDHGRTQVTTFRDEYKLPAVAVNSAGDGCTPQLMRVQHMLYI